MSETIPNTMKAAAIDSFGGIETITLQTLPVPDVGSDEVLIRVESAGVGVWDVYEREGGFAGLIDREPEFPYVLGSDGAGTVVATGAGVDRFEIGDRVYAGSVMNPRGGFYAEYASIPEANVAPTPEGLTTEQAGVVAVDAVTALDGLDLLELERGESVMVFGASGGIGHLALQIADRSGARVFAVASGDDGVALARRLGADTVVEGHGEDVAAAAREFAPGGLDAALLTAGGEAADEALTAMAEDGRVVFPNGVRPEPTPPAGIHVEVYDGTLRAEALERLNGLIESGPFEVRVARTFPLGRAADAQRALSDHYLGKLALRP